MGTPGEGGGHGNMTLKLRVSRPGALLAAGKRGAGGGGGGLALDTHPGVQPHGAAATGSVFS